MIEQEDKKMRKRAAQLMMGLGMSLAVMGSSVPCFADEAATETATEAETQVETETKAVTEAASETETESNDFVEGSAVLSDYGYVKGELTKEGWKSDFLKMEYVPDVKISIGLEENDKLDEYYGRNGEDKKVANSEMVALDEAGGYVQVTAEVNPKHEGAEDILSRFMENEKLDLAGKNKEMQIGGKTFLTVSGVVDKERYMLGISTEQDNIVVAVKVKYKDTEARKTLLNGFDGIQDEDTDETAETETETELPTEFTDAELIETTTETETE